MALDISVSYDNARRSKNLKRARLNQVHQVLRVHLRPAGSVRAKLGLLAPLGAPVLEPNLHAPLVQAQAACERLPGERIRVGRLLECALEHAELVACEHGPGRGWLACCILSLGYTHTHTLAPTTYLLFLRRFGRLDLSPLVAGDVDDEGYASPSVWQEP